MTKQRLAILVFTPLSLLALSAVAMPDFFASAGEAGAYVQWQAEGDAIIAPLTAVAGDPERGKQLLTDRRKSNCLACHRVPVKNQSFQGNIGPSLAGVASRLSPAQIRLRIVDERQLNPNTIMPGYYRNPAGFNRVAEKLAGHTIMSPRDIEDLVAYLGTLDATGPDSVDFESGKPPPDGSRVRSGYEYLNLETRDMQDDEFENPGMIAVEAGAALFGKRGNNGKSCSGCHGENGDKLVSKKIAAYPVYDESAGKPLTLQKRIQVCWSKALDNPPLAYSSPELVNLETFVRSLARGEAVNVDISGPMQPFHEAGKELYYKRFGQIDLACNHCHDDHAGQYLRGQLLSQGQSNGFPVYRLARGKITDLHTRMKQCFVKFRATPFPPGSDELVNLEVFLAARGNGLKIETPAVRF